MDDSSLPSGLNTPKSLATEGTVDGSAYHFSGAGHSRKESIPGRRQPEMTSSAVGVQTQSRLGLQRPHLRNTSLVPETEMSQNASFGQPGQVHRVDLRYSRNTCWETRMMPFKTFVLLAVVLLLYIMHCCLAVSVVLYLVPGESWKQYDQAVQIVTSLTGVLLGLLLILRLHSSCVRWQSAVGSWSSVAAHCTTMARLAAVHMGGPEGYSNKVVALCQAFPRALIMQLMEDRKLVNFDAPLLTVEESFEVLSAANMPLCVLDKISMSCSSLLLQCGLAPVFESAVHALAMSVFTCSSVKVQGQATEYTMHLRLLLVVWLAVLPFPLAMCFSWYALPPCAFLLLTLAGGEAVASHLDFPFQRFSGLPLDTHVTAIQQQIGGYYKHVATGAPRPGPRGPADASSTVIEMAAILLQREANRDQDGTGEPMASKDVQA